MVLRKVLDTNAVLYLLGGRSAHSLFNCECFVSVISEMELLSYPLLDTDSQATIEKFLSEVTIIGLTPAVKERAVLLRREHQVKLPDAIVAATALTIGAVLVTNDSKVVRLPGLAREKLELK